MASTFEGWTVAAAFSILFVMIFGLIVVNMNDVHSGDYEIEGLETDEIKDQLDEYSKSAQDRFEGGDVSFLEAGYLALSTSWNIIVSLFTMMMSFITGGWILTIIKYMRLPDIVGWMFRAIYIAVLTFVVLRVLFKRNV